MNQEQWGAKAAGILGRVRRTKPLVHHITNLVVMNETANITLCAGGLPVMAHADAEVEEMVAAAGALVLNIGTLTPELVETMLKAGAKANSLGIPIVLDPVGAGATRLRTESAAKILERLDVAIVRANAAEAAVLAGLDAEIRGVESIGGVAPDVAAASLARRYGCVTAVTGAIDFISDGKRTVAVTNGTPMMATVTGTGCMASAVVALFAAVEDDKVAATAGALAAYGLAGFVAAHTAKGPGSFHVGLYDAVAGLTEDALRVGARINDEPTDAPA